MNRPLKAFIAILLIALSCCATAFADPVPWDLAKWKEAPATFPAAEDVTTLARTENTLAPLNGAPLPEAKAITFEGPPYQGRPTKVFAVYGIPPGAAPDHKVPGIVLIHGAGGTAFVDWVRLWVSRGYAAIAIDDEGQFPIGTYNHWQANPEGGPRRSDVAGLSKPVADQWMYHAVGDAVLAHSLLASFPEVDPNRIGITGISWGGVVASNVASIDERLKFAIIVYGCGYISQPSDDGSQFVGTKDTPENVESWRKLWDPENFLPAAKIPILWVTGTNDFAFTLRAWQLSYLAAPGPRTLSLRERMKHGHNGPGETPEEMRVFADSITRQGVPLARISKPEQNDRNVASTYVSASPIQEATLNFTCDSGTWQQRKWESIPAQLAQDRVSAAVPETATTCFFTLKDERGLLVTSEHVSSPSQPSSPAPFSPVN